LAGERVAMSILFQNQSCSAFQGLSTYVFHFCFKQISLLQYLKSIFNGTGVEVSADETIACDLSYLQQLVKLISDTDERTIGKLNPNICHEHFI
jgi:hypothetical protein